MMKKWTLYMVFLFCCVWGIQAQQTDFPYPEIPDEVEEPEERLSYLLTHFWINQIEQREERAEGVPETSISKQTACMNLTIKRTVMNNLASLIHLMKHAREEN